jgi:hypothetical protein
LTITKPNEAISAIYNTNEVYEVTENGCFYDIIITNSVVIDDVRPIIEVKKNWTGAWADLPQAGKDDLLDQLVFTDQLGNVYELGVEYRVQAGTYVFTETLPDDWEWVDDAGNTYTVEQVFSYIFGIKVPNRITAGEGINNKYTTTFTNKIVKTPPTYELELEKMQGEEAELRRSQVGTGDRSEKIRTYNFPQGRVTDHRIKLTLHKLDSIMNGNLDEVIDSLITADQTAKLATMNAA